MKSITILLLLFSAMSACAADWDLVLPTESRGPGVALTNPALIAEPVRPPLGIELPGVGATASNNSFSVNFWNSTVADTFWDASETQAILDRIPEDGLEMNVGAIVPVFGVRYRNWAFNARGIGGGHLEAAKAVAQMAFVGVQIDESYLARELLGESAALSDFALSYAHVIPQPWVPGLAAGLTLHYYQGLFYSHASPSEAQISVSEDRIVGKGVFNSEYGTEGGGLGADLGLVATLNSRWQAAFSVQNLGATLDWTLTERTVATFETDVAGVDMDSVDNEEYTDRVFASSDTSYDGGEASFKLPVVIRASGLFHLNKSWSFSSGLGIITSDSPLSNAGLQAAGVATYHPTGWSKLEGGVLLGGVHEKLFLFGTGVRFHHYELDLGFQAAGGLFNAAHGAGVSLSQRLYL